MELTLHLEPELEQRLTQAAAQQALPVEKFAIRILEQNVPEVIVDKQAKMLALLESWKNNPSVTDDDDTWDDLTRALDEEREPGRKLFPPELKGITW